jgi:hypothetical protein
MPISGRLCLTARLEEIFERSPGPTVSRRHSQKEGLFEQGTRLLGKAQRRRVQEHLPLTLSATGKQLDPLLVAHPVGDPKHVMSLIAI